MSDLADRSGMQGVVSRWALAAVAGLLAWPAPASGPEKSSPVAFVVNSGNAVTELTSAQLRRIYLGEETRWDGKTKITILLLPAGREERRVLLERLLLMSDADFVHHWIAKVFQGEATSGPKTVSTPASMEKLVTGLPGAIGFLRAGDVTPGGPLRVLRIDGKVPGEPGYRFVP
ncbi:MAG: hypothetical protein U0529_19360 [Thermoanaerobaculia bacterium]